MSARRKILVTNDDGYASAGIVALAEALQAVGDVTVVAPDRDNSGVGHQISIRHPVAVHAIDGRAVPTYRCSGTPADCVVIGAFDLCGEMPALVVSGINRGANLGDDVNYSGTVAAAVEGAIVGVPAIAISLAASWPEASPEHHWATACDVAERLARRVLADELPRADVLNVNVPNRPASDVRGDLWVPTGRKGYSDRLDKRSDPRGDTYYWLWGAFDAATIVEGTDLAAVRDGYVSITPMSIDRTDRDALARRTAPSRANGARA